jgi:flagellar export protein FliJ
MKRFRFRLEAVRTLREVAERGQREAFGAALQRYATAEAAVQAAVQARRELFDHVAGTRSGVFRPSEQTAGLEALRQAAHREAAAEKDRQEAATARDRARETWLEARRALQIIERLEEKARAEHREAADKAEQSLLDELASIGAARASAK